MRTRREQMQAYRFVIRRIVAAVLSGEPETLDRPMRRLGISLFVSAMLAVLVFAGFGVYGLLTNPGSDLDEAGELIAVRDGGPIFVAQDGVLHPVPNLASGRLILGDVEVRQVSNDSLEGMPRGVPLGIPDAPFELPDSDNLLGLPWWVCSVPPGPGERDPKTTVVIDRGLASASSEVGQQALYVDSLDARYLLWNNTKLQVQDVDEAQAALNDLPEAPIRVGVPLLSSISVGPDLAPPRVPGDGRASDLVPGAEIGDLFAVQDQHYLLTDDGLGRINEVSVRLLEAQDVPTNELERGDVVDIGTSEDLEEEGFPAAVPEFYPATSDTTICTAYDGRTEGQLGTRIEVFESAPGELSAGAGAIPLTQTLQDPAPPADQAVIAGGSGALVRQLPHAQDEPREGETIYLITDQGIKYPISDDGSVEALGYGDVDPVGVTASLLALLPHGPTLSQEDASQPLRGTPAPATDPG